MDDLIRRQDAIDAVEKLDIPEDMCVFEILSHIELAIGTIPSVQLEESEVIRCKDCVKNNKGHGYYLDGTVIGVKDCCPLVEIRGMAQGHEFDYQYCAYAERRTNG